MERMEATNGPNEMIELKKKCCRLLMNSAGRPRFNTIFNPERVKLVATVLYCILFLATL